MVDINLNSNDGVLTPEQIAEKGQKIYNEKLKTTLEASQKGKFVAVEVETGEHFISDTLLGALQEARTKYPNKLFHTIKIGSEGVFKMGSYAKNLSYGW